MDKSNLVELTKLRVEMEQNRDDHQEIKKTLGEIKDSIETLDTRFSGKWVEKGIIAIIVAIVLGALYAVGDHIGIPLK